jgi:gliding motility-associated-like protein
LYSSEVAPEPIDQNSTGIFVVNATPADNYFLTYSDGACESVRSKVEISIAFPNIQIQNSFTPNGDGVNDYWYVKDLVDYPEATVQIYNRFGALIYKSRGYSAPFDGKLRGKELPAGTYYYIIELSAGCTPLKGSVSILR